jgi:hypothetical protein
LNSAASLCIRGFIVTEWMHHGALKITTVGIFDCNTFLSKSSRDVISIAFGLVRRASRMNFGLGLNALEVSDRELTALVRGGDVQEIFDRSVVFILYAFLLLFFLRFCLILLDSGWTVLFLFT